MAAAVASSYARALADAVLAPGSGLPAQYALDQLRAFQALIAGSHELRTVLMSPAVAASRKRVLVGRFGDRLALHRLVRNFLFVLIDHRRMDALGAIVEALETEIDSRLGVVRADVTSALPLDEKQRATLRDRLSHVTGKQARCQFRVDPGLIGGVLARIGSTIYDGSVRGQLETLRTQLTG